MKKVLLLSLLVLPFIFPGRVLAVCFKEMPTLCQQTQCLYKGDWYCCLNYQECTDFQNNPVTNCMATGLSCATLPCCGQDTCSSSHICQAPATPNSSINCNGVTTSINTAIGCIDFSSPEAFLGGILKWAVGIGGGIAFLLIIYAGFMIMTSSGNPERLKAGQELLTSALSGLILLILSIFILKFIGVDILGLCKFGFGICPP